MSDQLKRLFALSSEEINEKAGIIDQHPHLFPVADYEGLAVKLMELSKEQLSALVKNADYFRVSEDHRIHVSKWMHFSPDYLPRLGKALQEFVQTLFPVASDRFILWVMETLISLKPRQIKGFHQSIRSHLPTYPWWALQGLDL